MSTSQRLSLKSLIDDADDAVDSVPVEEAMQIAQDSNYLIVDVRDVRERKRDGFIAESFHCPRGMLEFWIDTESPYYKDVFDGKSRIMFHCAADWRAMLCAHTAQRMGIENAVYIKGGLNEWKAQGGPVAQLDSGDK